MRTFMPAAAAAAVLLGAAAVIPNTATATAAQTVEISGFAFKPVTDGSRVLAHAAVAVP